jgi:thiamine-phosphate pyrophosphorylase
VTTNLDEEVSLPRLFRLIDANLNRLQEGIRVVEDIYRYYFNDKSTAQELKALRHLAKEKEYLSYLPFRDIINDPLKETTSSEKKRDSINDIIKSNIKRSQESARVLEESYKLIDTAISQKYKDIRYNLYNIEKNIVTFQVCKSEQSPDLLSNKAES